MSVTLWLCCLTPDLWERCVGWGSSASERWCAGSLGVESPGPLPAWWHNVLRNVTLILPESPGHVSREWGGQRGLSRLCWHLHCRTWSFASENWTQTRAQHTEGWDSIQRDLDLSGGSVQDSWSSWRPRARSGNWMEAVSSTNRGWVEQEMRAALREELEGVDWWKKSRWPGNVSLQPTMPTKQSYQQIKGGDSAALVSWAPTWSSASRSGREKMGKKDGDLLEWGPHSTFWRGGPGRFSVGWNTSPMKAGWGSCNSSAWRRWGS